MKISGMQKLTLLDYPGYTACLLFTQGCNFRCPFCHNKDLLGTNNECNVEEEEVLSYLKKRQGILEGVVITGGEPLLQKDLALFIKKIKKLDYKIKIDTNGSNPLKLQELLDEKLVDYIAMDVKNDFPNYAKTAGCKNINIDNIKKSIEIIKSSNVDFEFRTTITKELHNIDNLKNILNYLGKDVKMYIQNYRDCDTVLKRGMTSFTEEELIEMIKELNKVYPNVKVRGI